jgi:site-specific recombinase XerD
LRYLLENPTQNPQRRLLVTSIYKKAQSRPKDLAFPISNIKKFDSQADNRILHPKVMEFLKRMEKEGKAKVTQVRFTAYMNMFLPWLSHNMEDFKSYEVHNIPTLKIKEMHLQEFRTYLLKKVSRGNYAQVTAAECLYAIRRFFQFLHRRYGFPNPAKRLKSIKAPRYHTRDIPTDVQIATLLQVINKYSDQPALDRASFRLMFSLGLRSIEVARLSWNDINLETRTIRIHGKGNRYDLLPLVGQLFNDLQLVKQSQNSSKYILGNDINKNKKTLLDNYKLYSLIAEWEFKGGLHLFRHLFITNLVKYNILPQAIQKLTRVEKLDTVSLYMHINRTWLNEQINILDYGQEGL